MTDTLKKLATAIPDKADTATAIYTTPASTTAVVRKAIISNRHVFDAVCKLSYSGGAAGEVVIVKVPGQSQIAVPLNLNLEQAAWSVFAQQYVDMTYTNMTVAQAVTALNTASDATVYATASWTSQTDEVYVMAVINSHGGGNATVPSSITDTHTGVTWTQVSTLQSFDGLLRITMYRAKASGSNATTTTANFGATQTGCHIYIAKVVGADLTGSHGENAVVRSGEYAPRTLPSSPIVIPASAWVGARLAVIAGNNSSGTYTWSTGWTELHDAINAEGITASMGYTLTPGTSAWATSSLGMSLTQPIGVCVGLQDPTDAITVSLHGVEITA